MAIKTKGEEITGAVQEAIGQASAEATSQTAASIDQTVAALKDGMSQATAGFETTQARFNEGVEKVMKTTEELVAFNQGNYEAFVKSGQIWAAGVQDLSRQVAASAQASFEQGLASFKALTSVKSFKEAIDLQSNLARSAIEKTIAEFEQADRCFDEAHRADDSADRSAGELCGAEVLEPGLIRLGYIVPRSRGFH